MIVTKDDVLSGLNAISAVSEHIRTGKSGSLIDYTKPSRVEPITLVDARSAQLPYIEEVLSSALNIFSAYYLQAAALSVNIGSVNVMRLLQKLSPDRDVLDQDIGNWRTLLESRDVGIPFFTMENTTVNAPVTVNIDVKDDPKPSQPRTATVSNSIRDINESANLSVGKLLDIQIESNGTKASVPVQVRLRTNIIRPSVLAHTLSLSSKKTNIKDRYHKWRSGQLEFLKDIVLCRDLIDQHRKNLLDDPSGYYRQQQKTKSKNIISSIISANPSVATASSVVIMNADTAKELESGMRGKLSRFRDREKLFNETMAMLFFVIDPDWDQITIYHRTIEDPTTVSVREIQRSNKNGKGPDITQILNAFLDKKSPTI